MAKVLVLVEGQTEETFVREVLKPFLKGRNVYPIAKLATTKRVKRGSDFKGGVVSYGKIRNDIVRLLGDSSTLLVTTMIDFYSLPSDFPGLANRPTGSPYEQADYLEQQFLKDINNPKFYPYLQLHEFEALLFVAPDKIAESFPGTDALAELQDIHSQFSSPEEIDDQLPPSKRLKTIFPEYRKPLFGSLIALEIGIDSIRNECKHFDQWLRKLETLADS